MSDLLIWAILLGAAVLALFAGIMLLAFVAEAWPLILAFVIALWIYHAL